jgi:hypothetical protein
LPAMIACGTGAAAGGGGGADGSAGAGGSVTALDPGSKEMHRLNSTEYNTTIADTLGTALEPASGNWRGGELAGFDNIASVLSVDEAQYQRYFEAAKALATDVMASDKLRARFVSCQLAEPACATACITTAGLRLLRRPLEPQELRTYQRVFDSARALGDDASAAFTLVLQAMLSSAEFVYRIEVDPTPESTAGHPLGPYELASRLSYFLWSSAPDDALLDAASNGSLLRGDLLSATVDRMLDDPRSERLATNFAGQWLGAREVLSHPVAPKFYRWSQHAARAASAEILLYFSEFFRSGRSWFEFASADINYVDPALAGVYDIPTASDRYGMMERVEHHADQRAGFFGLAGFLAITSLDRRTSPSRRGRWIASNLLCSNPPPPPANVPDLEGDEDSAEDPSAALNVRQSLERHRQDPGCATCHALFDPYGLALERYDAIGAYRSVYDDGAPIDASVTLPPSAEQPSGPTFEGLDGLSRAVSANPRFGACLAKKLFTYGLGRVVTTADDPHLQAALREWLAEGQTPSIRRLIHALVSSEAFRSRRGAAEVRRGP